MAPHWEVEWLTNGKKWAKSGVAMARPWWSVRTPPRAVSSRSCVSLAGVDALRMALGGEGLGAAFDLRESFDLPADAEMALAGAAAVDAGE